MDIRDCITENDGKTFCFVRAFTVTVSLLFIFGEVYHFCQDPAKFDMMQFAAAAAAMIGTITLGFAFKSYAESRTTT